MSHGYLFFEIQADDVPRAVEFYQTIFDWKFTKNPGVLIEYWDIERRRYPQYEHSAVLIAEDVTTRFLHADVPTTGVVLVTAVFGVIIGGAGALGGNWTMPNTEAFAASVFVVLRRLELGDLT